MAGNIADSLRLVIAKTYDVDKKAELLYQLGEQLKKSNPDSAVVVLKEAQVLFHDKESRLTAKTHNRLGEIYLNMGQIKNATSELKTAVTVLDKFSDSKELVTSYMLLGNIFIQKDNLAEAMEYYNEAILIAQQLSDSIRLSQLYNNLGILNLYLNNNKKALALYSKALELYKKSNDTTSIAGTTTNIGSIYVNLGDYQTAEKYYIQGWKLFKSVGSVEGEAHALLKIGSLEIKRHQYDSAVVFLNKCISKLDQIETTYSGIRSIFLAEALINKGIALYENNDFENAIQVLEKGMKTAGKDEDLGLISQASEYISKYYSKKQDYKKALEYYKIFKQASDSIHNEENIKKIARLETKLEYEKNLHNKTWKTKLWLKNRNVTNSIFFYSHPYLF
jgi:tetratricopeptide (TPR) repeat protein